MTGLFETSHRFGRILVEKFARSFSHALHGLQCFFRADLVCFLQALRQRGRRKHFPVRNSQVRVVVIRAADAEFANGAIQGLMHGHHVEDGMVEVKNNDHKSLDEREIVG